MVSAAVKLQRRVSSAIASARPKIPHRGSGGALGGTLVVVTRSRALLIKGKSHAGVAWSKAGQKLTWFLRGTTVRGKLHQAPRRIDLTLKPSELAADVERDALRHFTQRERRERPRT